MKATTRPLVALIALLMTVAIHPTANSQQPRIQLASGVQPDPLLMQGKSAGGPDAGCGYMPTAAAQVVEIASQIPYLRFTASSDRGEATLLIEGPTGRFCAFADSYTGENPEISGMWAAGTYSIFIGNRQPGEHTYNLSISAQPQ
uniref:SH3 domain-containing protein n=1 Tax=Planktothricoides sp. SpSt-374 TaxID=2282167 RepID=A0A7C3VQJ2_9CYAN